MRVAALLTFTLIASACSAASPPETGTEAVTTPTTTWPAATTTTTTPRPPSTTVPGVPPGATTTTRPEAAPPGTVVVGPGEPIQIRVLQALSGGAEEFGIGQAQAVELAIADFGPIHGHPVDVGEPRDEQCSSDRGRAEGEAIAAEPDVVAVIGSTCSGAAAPAVALLSAAGIVMIAGSTTSPELTSDTRGAVGGTWRPGFFRTAPNDAGQGVTAARFAAEQLGATRAVALHREDPFTRTLTEAFAATFRELGGSAATIPCKPCDESDVDTALAAAAADSPDVLFLPFFLPEAGVVLARYRDVPGLTGAAIIGGDGFTDDELLASEDSRGIYLVVADRRFSATSEHDAYLDRFVGRFGDPPPTPRGFRGDAAAYDATRLLLTALTDVAVADGEMLLIDRAALRERLYETAGLPGVTGTLACDRFGDCAGHGFVVLQHDDPSDPAATAENVVYEAPPPWAEPTCDPTTTEEGSVIGPEARLATVADVEVWALIFPHAFALGGGEPVRLPVGEELKIVFRITGLGDPTIDAVGPGGNFLAPTDGPDRHDGSNWDRPGEEYGTGWELRDPGCWTIRVVRDSRVASLVVEAYAP